MVPAPGLGWTLGERPRVSVLRLLLLLTQAGVASTNDDFVRTAAQASPPMVTCPGRWLDFTSPLTVPAGASGRGPENHFDGDHSFGPDGTSDFASCLQQCTNRSGCHMFEYGTIGTLPHKCGVPSAGLPGAMVLAPAFIPVENVAVYTLGTCTCPGCCIGIVAPANGNAGTCSGDGTLAVNTSCDLVCNPGFEMANGSTRITCDNPGAVLSAGQVECTPCDSGRFSPDGSPCQACEEPSRPGEFVEYACLPHVSTTLNNCSPPCANGFGESVNCVAGTALQAGSDRVCEQCMVGVSYSPGGNSSVCTPCTVCSPGQEQSSQCYPWSDTVCATCGTGRYSVDGLQCLACSTCDPGYGEVITCNGTRNSACAACPDDKWSSGGFLGSTCEYCNPCVPGEEQLGHCTVERDTVCQECQPGFFSVHGNSSCEPCASPCAPGQEEVIPCTNRTNRVCTNCSEGRFSLGSSASSLEMRSSETTVSPSATATITTVQSTVATTYAVCTAFTVCAETEYEAASPTASSDRWCVPFECVPPCDHRATCTAVGIHGSEHTAVCGCVDGLFGTGFTCMPVSECSIGLTFEYAAPTTTSDRVCVDTTLCSAGHYESRPATLVEDRVCSACPSGTYQPYLGQLSCPNCTEQTYDQDGDSTTQCALCPDGFFVSADRSSCRAAAVIALVLHFDIVSIPELSPARANFVQNLTQAVSSTLSVEPDRVRILGIDSSPSSRRRMQTSTLLVHVEILPSESGIAVDSVALLSSAVTLGGFVVVSAVPVDDPCALLPCDEHATCSRLAFGNYQCECKPPYFGTGATCLPTQPCVPGHTWEQLAPTSDVDRFCGVVTECQPGEFEVGHATNMSDRTCAKCHPGWSVTAYDKCIPCGNTTYDHDSSSATPCEQCPVGRLAVVEGAVTCFVDDACLASAHSCVVEANCSRTGVGTHACECNQGFFGTGQWCTPWSECVLGLSFAVNLPTSQRDRVCVVVSTCLTTEFETRAPTLTSDRECSLCNPGNFVVMNGDDCLPCPSSTFDHDSLSSTACEACPRGSTVDATRTRCDVQDPCVLSTTHDCHAAARCNCTGFGAHTCECHSGFYGTGQWCVPWSTCVLNITFASREPTSTQDRVCEAVQQCRDDETEALAPSLTGDRVCIQCTAGNVVVSSSNMCEQCAPGRYDHDSSSSTACQHCAIGFLVNNNRTACMLHDPCAAPQLNDCHVEASCTRISSLDYHCQCHHGFWGDGKWCAPWSVCTPGTTYSVREPSHLVDRICSAVTVCKAGEYESRAPGCMPILASSAGSWSYGDNCAGVVFDRLCTSCEPGTFQPLHNYVPADEIRADSSCPVCRAATFDHDSDPTTACKECAVGHVVTRNQTGCVLEDPCAGPGFNNCAAAALCSTLSPGTHLCECTPGFYGDGTWCAPHSECTPGRSFQSRAPNSTHDRECQPATVCNAGQQEVRQLNTESDRQCEPCVVGTFSSAGEAICHPCSRLHIDHDADPSTPCQANIGFIVGAIVLLSVTAIVVVFVAPLYCSQRPRVLPQDSYTPDGDPDDTSKDVGLLGERRDSASSVSASSSSETRDSGDDDDGEREEGRSGTKIAIT